MFSTIACQKSTTGVKGTPTTQNTLSGTDTSMEPSSKNNYKSAKTAFMTMNGKVWNRLFALSTTMM